MCNPPRKDARTGPKPRNNIYTGEFNKTKNRQTKHMITIDFLATVVLLSASGVLSPGPLFIASTLRATKQGTMAGFQCAIGHTIIEFPLVVGLAVGVQSLLLSAKNYVALIGGIVLLGLASLQLLQARRKVELNPSNIPEFWQKGSGIMVGLVLTAANPFFILWWATIGTALTSEALALGAFSGVITMFAAHIWMDYAWLGGTATLVGRGRLFLGKWYRAMLVGFSLVMIYFGISFILSAFA